MTENNELRAVVLAALMVFSVFGGTIAFAGAASAITYDRGGNDSQTYDTIGSGTNNVGAVGEGEIIFQGEEDIELRSDGTAAAAGDLVNPSALERTSGDNEGVPLQFPVPEDAVTGGYSEDGAGGGFTVTVATPRITTFDVQNQPTTAGDRTTIGDGSDVNGGTLVADGSGAHVEIDYNFEEAEAVELTVEDENGVDITNEILADTGGINRDAVVDGATTASPTDDDTDITPVSIELNPRAVDEGEYTFSVSGIEDLDFDDAAQSTTVEIVSSEQASLALGQESASQGEDVDFTLDESSEGNFHAVVINRDDFREDIDEDEAAGIFRNVGDTTDTGLLDGSGATVTPTAGSSVSGSSIDAAYAIVEIDGGTGVGSIETQFVSDTTVTVDVFESDSASPSPTAYTVNDAGELTSDLDFTDDGVPTDDDQDLDVQEGSVQLDNPSGTYIVGQDINLNGTATEGTQNVVVYVRDRGDFEHVEIDGDNVISVDGDNTFSEDDVDLTEGGSEGNNILSLTGSYRIGVISEESTRQVTSGLGGITRVPSGTAGDNIPVSIPASEFNGGISSSDSIVVTDTELESNVVTYNGQVAEEDELNAINVTGRAPGQSNVGVIFVGPRGNVDATTVSVESDGTFSQEDIAIESLSQGTVSAHVLSAGRDGIIGDSFDGGTGSALSIGDFVEFVDGNTALPGTTRSTSSAPQGFDGTANQVRDRVLANTVDDTASDDIMDTTTFRKSDGLTTLESVTSPIEPNGTIEIEGQTNRKPDDNTIVLELLDQSDSVTQSTSTDQWGTNGTYSASIELDGVEPGEYQLESDDGDNTDRASVEVVEQVDEEETPTTATPEPDTPTPTPTATPEPDTPTPTEEPADDTETDTPSTDAGTPGFGIVVALTALIAAALLAVRRTN